MLTPLSRLFFLAVAAMCFLAAFLTPGHAQTLQIDSIKANYIEGFLDFVRWDGELENENAVIAVLGSQELVSHLEKIAQSKSAGRALRVVKIDSTEQLTGANILFVGSGYNPNWQALNELCAEQRILLIGEEIGFLNNGGAIEFIVRKNRLRFKINTVNARRCGIEVASQLVELALD